MRFTNEGKIFWELYDDNNIKRFSSFKEVVMSCVNANYYPTLLFYRKCSELSKSDIRMKKSEEINLNDRKIVLARCAERDDFMKKNKLPQEHASQNNSFQLLNDDTDYMVRNDNLKNSTTITTNDINLKGNEGIISSLDNKTLRNDMSELKNEVKKNSGVEYNRFYEPNTRRVNHLYQNFPSQIPKLNITKKFKENPPTLTFNTQPNPPVNNVLSSKQFNSDTEKMYQKNNQVNNFKPQMNPLSNNQSNPQNFISKYDKGYNTESREKDNSRNKIIPNNGIDNHKFNGKNKSENVYGRYLNSNYQNNAYERNVPTNKDTNETKHNSRSYNIEDEKTTETFNSYKDISHNQSSKEYDNIKMMDKADVILCFLIFLIVVILFLLLIYQDSS